MTYKTGKMSVDVSICLYDVNIIKTLRLEDCYEYDETWRIYSVGCGTILLGSGIWISASNFPCAVRGHPELSLVSFSDSLNST